MRGVRGPFSLPPSLPVIALCDLRLREDVLSHPVAALDTVNCSHFRGCAEKADQVREGRRTSVPKWLVGSPHELAHVKSAQFERSS